jgi:hypothetical protein
MPDQTPKQTDAPPSRLQALLAQVNLQLNEFDAKRLGEFKSEVETFWKKQADVVADYRKQYPALRDRWCRQQQDVVQPLYSAIKSAFPEQPWQQIVCALICAPRRDRIDTVLADIQGRLQVSRGAHEGARDDALAAYQAAKAQRDALTANAGGIDAALTANAALATQITALLNKPDRAVALYLFWFKLLPSHRGLRPSDISQDCEGFAKDETPEKLCAACADAAAGAAKDAPAPAAAKAAMSRSAPWLIAPDDYATALDDAWWSTSQAKDAYASAESAYRADPDDIPARQKQLEASRKTIDDDIKAGLAKWRPTDTCCSDTTAKA